MDTKHTFSQVAGRTVLECVSGWCDLMLEAKEGGVVLATMGDMERTIRVECDAAKLKEFLGASDDAEKSSLRAEVARLKEALRRAEVLRDQYKQEADAHIEAHNENRERMRKAERQVEALRGYLLRILTPTMERHRKETKR